MDFGHPFLTDDFGRLRSKQRRILAVFRETDLGLVTRAGPASIELAADADPLVAEVHLREEVDRMLAPYASVIAELAERLRADQLYRLVLSIRGDQGVEAAKTNIENRLQELKHKELTTLPEPRSDDDRNLRKTLRDAAVLLEVADQLAVQQDLSDS